jgi:hypothetical protein
MTEIWKDIKGFEGVYKVSNQGRIESIERYYIRGGNCIMLIKGKIIKAENKYSHKSIILSDSGKTLKTSIHREVYKAFVGEIKIGFVINHINGIKSDNRVENLEMITQSENILHAYRTGLIVKKPKKS